MIDRCLYRGLQLREQLRTQILQDLHRIPYYGRPSLPDSHLHSAQDKCKDIFRAYQMYPPFFDPEVIHILPTLLPAYSKTKERPLLVVALFLYL